MAMKRPIPAELIEADEAYRIIRVAAAGSDPIAMKTFERYRQTCWYSFKGKQPVPFRLSHSDVIVGLIRKFTYDFTDRTPHNPFRLELRVLLQSANATG